MEHASELATAPDSAEWGCRVKPKRKTLGEIAENAYHHGMHFGDKMERAARAVAREVRRRDAERRKRQLPRNAR